MSRAFYSILLALGVLAGRAQNLQPNAYFYGLKDFVKQVKEYSYQLDKKKKTITDSTTYLFDNEGHLKKLDSYRIKDSFSVFTTIHYDNRGLMLSKNEKRTSMKKAAGTAEEIEYRYAYDQRTRMEQILEFNPKTVSTLPFSSFYYDMPKDLKWPQTDLPPKSEGPAKMNYICGSNGLVSGSIENNTGPKYYDLYTYNEKNELIKHTWHYLADSAGYNGLQGEALIKKLKQDSLNKIAGSLVLFFSYDAYGHQLTQTAVRGDSSMIYTITSSYTFDKRNNWVTRTMEHEQKVKKGNSFVIKKFRTFHQRKIDYFD